MGNPETLNSETLSSHWFVPNPKPTALRAQKALGLNGPYARRYIRSRTKKHYSQSPRGKTTAPYYALDSLNLPSFGVGVLYSCFIGVPRLHSLGAP